MKLLLLGTALACISPSFAWLDRMTSKSATSRIHATSMTYCPPMAVSAPQQEAIFRDFVQVFYVEGSVNKTAAHFDVNYIQHNANVLSGRQAFVDIFSAGGGGNTTTTIVHMALKDNIAWVHYKSVTPGTPLTAVVDIFRFNGSCIMEHWDAIEALPTNATNPLALF
jgi:predicted SnoaL-like aldol condensation-catalyzing enzyme